MEAVARSKSGSGPAFPYQTSGVSSSDTTDVVQRIASPLRRTSSAFANILTPSKHAPMPVPPRNNRLHSTNSSLDSLGKNSFFGSFRGGGGGGRANSTSMSMSLKDNNIIRPPPQQQQQQQQRRDPASRASTTASTRPPSALLDRSPMSPSPLSPDDSADKVMRRSQSVPTGNTLRYATSISPFSASRNRSDTAYGTKVQPPDVDETSAVPIPVSTTLTSEAKDAYTSEFLVDQQTLYSPDGPTGGGSRPLEVSRSSEASAASALLREESGKDTYDKLDLDDCIDVDSDGLDSPRVDDYDSDGDGSVIGTSPGGVSGGDPGLLSPRTNEFLMTQRSHRSDSLDSIPPPTTSSRRLMPTSFMEVTYPATTEVAQTNKMPKKASQLDMLRHAPVATLNTVLKKKKKRKESGTKTINIERISLYLEGRAMLLQKTYNRHADLTNGIHPIDPLTLVISVPLKEGWLLVREVTEKYRYQNANVWKLRYCILCDAFDSSGPMLFYYPNHEVGVCMMSLCLCYYSFALLRILCVLSYTFSNLFCIMRDVCVGGAVYAE